jgi:hypothetical protein
MNLYYITFKLGSRSIKVTQRAMNKQAAIVAAKGKLTWRERDRITDIEVIEDKNNI